MFRLYIVVAEVMSSFQRELNESKAKMEADKRDMETADEYYRLQKSISETYK